MIIFTIEKIEDFLYFLERRVSDEIFFHVEEDSSGSEFPGKAEIEVVLHFIGKKNDVVGLYQTKLRFSKSLNEDKIFEEMRGVFDQTEIKFIRGHITELFISSS